MNPNDDQSNEELDVTTNAETSPGAEPDADDKSSPRVKDDREPEVLPDDPDILGNDGSSDPG